MNPFASRSIVDGSQSVNGRAPIMRNSACASTVDLAPSGHVAEDEVLEPAVAASTHHLGLDTHLDVLRRFDLAHQVLRHPGAERRSPDDQRDAAWRSGRGGGRLDRPSWRPRRRRPRRRPAPGPPRSSRRSRRRRRGAPRGTARRAGGSWPPWPAAPPSSRTGPPSESSTRRSVVLAREAGDGLHEGEARPEHPGLAVGPLRELPTAEAAREAEVVADQRAGGGLAADRRPCRPPAWPSPRTPRTRPPRGPQAQHRR